MDNGNGMARDAAARYAGEIRGRLDVVLQRLDQQDEARERNRAEIVEHVDELSRRVEGPDTGHIARLTRRLEQHELHLKLLLLAIAIEALGLSAILLGWERAVAILQAIAKLV